MRALHPRVRVTEISEHIFDGTEDRRQAPDIALKQLQIAQSPIVCKWELTRSMIMYFKDSVVN